MTGVRAQSPLRAKEDTSKMVTTSKVSDVTVQAHNTAESRCVRVGGSKDRRWQRRAGRGKAVPATFLSPLGALSHDPETGQTQRLPARTTLRGQRPPAVYGPACGREDLGAPTGLWFPLGTTRLTGSRPREAPCRLWRGRHSNRESRRPGRLQQRLQGQDQLQPPSPRPPGGSLETLQLGRDW